LKIHQATMVVGATLVVTLAAALAGCGGGSATTPTPSIKPSAALSASPTVAPTATGSPTPPGASPNAGPSSSPSAAVSILSVNSPVHLGETVTLTARSTPGVTCSIEYIHPSGKASTEPQLIPKAVGIDGTVSWSWPISPGTRPLGTGTVSVTCNGASSQTQILIQ
jgi:hypothetical protein